MQGIRFLIILILLAWLSCTNTSTPPPLFESLDSSYTGVDFVNKVKNEEDFNIFSYRNFYNGAGVAIGDINGDGLPDIYLTANMGSNKLYLNKGDFQFEDITDAAGVGSADFWSTGVSLVDINQDGLLDIYVCNAGFRKGADEPRNQLYINNGDLTFSESAADYGLDDPGYTTHAAFFDYDGDGLLDCYILNNSFIPVNTLNYSNKRELNAKDWPVKEFLQGGGDKLMRNTGQGFVDVSEEAGIYSSLIGFGLGVTVGDINNDGWPDIYVSNDFFERDYLYINQQDGTFKEDLTNQMQHISLSSMGADMADINNDGLSEIFVTDMLPHDEYRLKTTTEFEKIDVYNLKVQRDFYHQFAHNTLQLNTGDDLFKQISFHAGVAATDWSWGALMFDADGDGYQDILVCNGIYHDVIDQDFIDFFANDVIQKMTLSGKKEAVDSIIQKMPSNPIRNFMFRNQGDLTFVDQAQNWGLDDMTFSNGAAYADLDGDGDLDLVINNVNQPLLIYRNNAAQDSTYQYLKIRLKGSESNTFAIGAKIKLFQEDAIQQRELIPNRGFQSSVDFDIHFGIIAGKSVDSIQVIWPDRQVSSHFPKELNKVYVYDLKEQSTRPYTPADNLRPPLLEEINHALVSHEEDVYVDFDFERNLPMKLSKEGPSIGMGDFNGDGVEDVIIGGARGQKTQMYLGNADGGFEEAEGGDLTRYPEFEDTAICVFDANGDGIPDVFIGSGGNFQQPNTREKQDRIYLNQGDGTFILKTDAFPINGMNTSVAIAQDVNGDGFPDLVVGSRSLPFQYGVPPRSYLYVNDGSGKFEDKTKEIIPDLAELGMICDAIWVDLDSDDQEELVVVGEWMAPIIFREKEGVFSRVDIPELSDKSGWWYSVYAVDLTGNGYKDLVLGNRGTNGYLGSRQDMPIKLFINDYDNNGTADKIITRQFNNTDVPVVMKRDMTVALPSLKKANLTHHQYAGKSIYDLFDENKIKGSFQRKAENFQSGILYNNGNDQYEWKSLPTEVQLSSICAIASHDINGDGLPDLIMGGNHFVYQPQYSRLDASFGHVLINDGNRNFTILKNRESGLQVKGQIKDISIYSHASDEYLCITVNDEKPRIYKLPKSKAQEL